MADVHVQSYGSFGNNVLSGTPSPLPRPYLPSLPPSKTIKPSYSRFLVEAPYSALAGVVADARDPPKPPFLPRSRNRIQVGYTNRWRLPNMLGSDLLGSSQALKSVNSSYNDSIMAVMTADCRMASCNHADVTAERSFKSPIHVHALISPRFLKSQPAPGHSTSITELDRRFVRSQPALQSGSPRSIGNTGLSTFHLKQIDYQRNVLPPGLRSPTPMELFLCRSQTAGAYKAPDVVVHALDSTWELHKPYLQKSSLLSSLLRRAEMTGMTNIEEEEEGDTPRAVETGSNLDALKTAASCGNMEPVAVNTSDLSLGASRRRSSHDWYKNQLTFRLRIKDPLITNQTFALALAALYENENEINVSEADAVGVLAAASFLGFSALEKLCADVMLRSIAAWSVCAFHASASKYKQSSVVDACERWLELNLVPQLSVQIFLSHLPQDLLEKCLKSTKLFTWSEYSLYKLLAYWIFLKQHPNLQMMPSWGTVVTWFMSLPKITSFLDREEGHGYVNLFRTVRLGGITDSSQLDELQKMNLVPQSWLLRVYAQHYHALQGGGDMSLMTRFEYGAVRKGFILEEHLKYHSEIMSLHGFHFEVKAARDDTDSKYSFYLQRLKPNDPVLSFRACERHTFSMRHDREVRYCVRVQWSDCGVNKMFSTGILCQSFGFSGKARQSEVVSVEDVRMPLYVTVSLMFPPS